MRMLSSESLLHPASHRDVLSQYHQEYNRGVRDGDFIPFTYPMATYGGAVLLLFFLIVPRSRAHCLGGRVLTFILIASWHVFLILKCRSESMAVSFGIGSISMWAILWSATLLIFRDAKVEFKRIKKDGYIDAAARHAVGAPNAHQGMAQSSSSLSNEDRNGVRKDTLRPHYSWQPYPDSPWKERFEWIVDLLSNFRGYGWNWTISGLPSRPLVVQASLKQNCDEKAMLKDIPVSFKGIKRFDSRKAVILHNLWLFAKGYMAMDVLKVLSNHDPYFWGQIYCPPPAHLPQFMQDSAFLLRGYRSFATMCMVWIVLRTIFCCGPLIFVGLLGPQYLGSNGEPWMYPDHYGNVFSNMVNRGLAGWWGGWWHQTFRYGFQAGGDWITRLLGLDPQSQAAHTLQLFVAFSLSGMLHGAGSITMLGGTSPWSGSFLFFFLQSFGILIELAWRRSLRRAGLLHFIPNWVGQVSNLIYANVWLWFTAPLLADDFAKGGLWQMEPVMLSPLRAMGYGVHGDGFYCWGGKLTAWHTDRRWWLSGIEL